jgi:hypothetical protein
VFGGVASARFHRPPAGLGLDERVQAHIRSMRMVQGAFSDWFAAGPHNDLLHERTENSCYCRAVPGKELAVVFFDHRAVAVDLTDFGQQAQVRWLDVMGTSWSETRPVDVGRRVPLDPPRAGFHVAMVTRAA